MRLVYHSKGYFNRPNKIVGRERRERVSQLAWWAEGALIRAAASTQPLGRFNSCMN
jgi:hypothetical protein